MKFQNYKCKRLHMGSGRRLDKKTAEHKKIQKT